MKTPTPISKAQLIIIWILLVWLLFRPYVLNWQDIQFL